MIFGERLKEARIAAGLSQEELGKRVGLKQGTVAEAESIGRSSRKILDYAKALNVNPEWLATGKGKRKPIEDEPDLPMPTSDEYAAVQQLDMKASCGSGTFNEHVVVKGELAFKKSFLRKLGVEEKFARAVYAEGDSNDPTIKDGCVVLINTNDNTPIADKFFLICDPDGASYIKRLIREFSEKTGSMAWIMRSDNANKKDYPDKPLPIDDRTTIVGRCVWNDNLL